MGGSMKLIVFLLGFSLYGNADIKLTVIQTSDLHSHFTNQDSAFQLGGLARVATKIQELRDGHANSLLVDAGDYSEGTIFFALDSGERSHKVMEAFGYDAIVLGNHDWLIGPAAMYEVMENARFKIPILSANLNLENLPKNINLQKYISPYIIKNVGGLRVGIFGLSTFQFIFDKYFKPAKLSEPSRVAISMARFLKDKQKCDVVFVVSHLGLTQDKIVARAAPAIDGIFGGHDHDLFSQPVYVGRVPIFHVGRWGEHIGEFEFTFDQGRTRLSSYKVHRIDDSIPEEPNLKSLIDGAVLKIEEKFGMLATSQVLRSEVDLPAHDLFNESIMGNWSTDAVRLAAQEVQGKVDLAIDSPTYAARDIFRGSTSGIDIFNIFPHIFNLKTQKTWTIQTFDVTGRTLKYLLSGFYKFGLNIKVSNATVVLDHSNYLNPIENVTIDGRPLQDSKSYKVAATEGVLGVFEAFQGWGIPLAVKNLSDTGLEPWRVVSTYLQRKGEILRDDIKWEGRVRTVQPDLIVRPEEFVVRSFSPRKLTLEFTVRNNGLRPAPATHLSIQHEDMGSPILTPSKDLFSLGDFDVPEIPGGDAVLYSLDWDVKNLKSGRYPLIINIKGEEHPKTAKNNELRTFVDIP